MNFHISSDNDKLYLKMPAILLTIGVAGIFLFYFPTPFPRNKILWEN